ncbi:MAG TPA: sigma-70 family RNA polymerase sigma factor [Acetivibrio sp.]|nr:sigma-70 family RNA polymerase sigma factor [Clostridium sp.]HOQ36128.1 sigma-70 family RNA polymerase sigma factor [Acetivibrio sp.]HPT90905.1 sigma-70 family RNA polymerase sigma factor [Acetivibrio sp.]HQA57257.1 sigma-70 family RNA polymerase sigma factor [Acetivibrio sp.]
MEQESFCANDSLESVINAYSNMVYRLAFSHTRDRCSANDIYQEVFLRYIRKRPQFETEKHRKAWLIRVTVNCCRKMWTSSWKKKIVPLDESIIFETKEETNLHYELQKLPVKYRTVIHLFYYEDLKVEEIGEILHKKPSTVRAQLTRARSKLKEILKEGYDV